MKKTPFSRHRLLAIGAAVLVSVVFPGPARLRADEKAPARDFIARFGEKWSDHFAAEYESAYPFGRSSRKHDEEISQSSTLAQASDHVTLTNKHYFFDGDWYVVQWLYGATMTRTGRRQTESTVAFGRVKDGKIVVWEEYFDDRVGELQFTDQLPLYGADEEPYPWPGAAKLKHPYRP